MVHRPWLLMLFYRSLLYFLRSHNEAKSFVPFEWTFIDEIYINSLIFQIITLALYVYIVALLRSNILYNNTTDNEQIYYIKYQNKYNFYSN